MSETKRSVVVPIETDESGEICTPRECNPSIAGYCDDHYCKIYNVYCEIDEQGKIIRVPACRAAEIEVDESVVKCAKQIKAHGVSDFLVLANLAHIVSKAYLKFARAAGKVKE